MIVDKNFMLWHNIYVFMFGSFFDRVICSAEFQCVSPERELRGDQHL